jgi:hypothetical protein
MRANLSLVVAYSERLIFERQPPHTFRLIDERPMRFAHQT